MLSVLQIPAFLLCHACLCVAVWVSAGACLTAKCRMGLGWVFFKVGREMLPAAVLTCARLVMTSVPTYIGAKLQHLLY